VNFELSEEQKMVRDAVRDFAREVVAPRAADIDQTGEFPINEFRQAGELGFAGVGVGVTHRRRDQRLPRRIHRLVPAHDRRQHDA